MLFRSTNTKHTTDVHLQKRWRNTRSGYSRPEVEFKLHKKNADGTFTDISTYADGNAIGSIKLSTGNNFQVNLSGLAKYEDDGETLIKYFISEEPIPGYVRVTEKTELEVDAANNVSSGSIEKDRKSTRLNSSHGSISYAVFCLKKKNIVIV